jgi:hypothetical protein
MWERLRGLLGRERLGADEGLWIANCSAVHTIGMRFPIDVVFLDRRGRVLKISRRLRPWRVAAVLRGDAALELAAGAAAGIDRGDQLAWGEREG